MCLHVYLTQPSFGLNYSLLIINLYKQLTSHRQAWLHSRGSVLQSNIPIEIQIKLEKPTTIEDQGQTNRITTLPRPYARDSAAAVGLGRATPHASPR